MNKVRQVVALAKYVSYHVKKRMALSVKIGSVTFPVALLALAGWMAYLGIVYKDDWAKGWVWWLIATAVVLHFLWWASKQ